MRYHRSILYCLAAWVLLAASFGACNRKATPTASTDSPAALVWMQIDPIQCQGNPWEQNPPSEAPPAGMNKEEWRVRNYLREEFGIEPSGYKSYRVYENVCDACNCPRGDRIEIELTEHQAKQLTPFNWVPLGSVE